MKYYFFLLILAVFPIVSAFIVVPKANLALDPSNPVVYNPNITENVNPTVIFNVLNNGSRSAGIVNYTLSSGSNYIVRKAPNTINPGYTTSFEFEIIGDACSIASNNFNFGLWYYTYNNIVSHLVSDSYSFNAVQYLSTRIITPADNLVIQNGNVGSIQFSVVNNGFSPAKIKVNVTYVTSQLYATLNVGGISYFVNDLNDTVFTVGAQSELLFNLLVYQTEPIDNAQINFIVMDNSCNSLISSFSKSVKTLIISDNFLTPSIVPDLSDFSFLLIFSVGMLFIAKFSY